MPALGPTRTGGSGTIIVCVAGVSLFLELSLRIPSGTWAVGSKVDCVSSGSGSQGRVQVEELEEAELDAW